MKCISFSALKKIIQTTVKGIGDHNLLTFAASIAFYTIFSLPGLLIIIIVSAGLFLGQDAVEGELVEQLQGFIGSSSAQTVQEIIVKIQLSGDITWKTILGVGTLVFSATTIFMSLQEALNRIWDVVALPQKSILKYLINRALSFGMIISLAFILLVSFLLDALLQLFFNKVENVIGKEPSFWLSLSSNAVSIGLTFIIIALIFKVLPDVKLKWSNVTKAAGLTTLFLVLGNYLIGLYISTSNFSQTYSAAGSVIVILVWVYYSTTVLLIGAEITRAIMIHNHNPIRPSEGAKKINVSSVDYDTYKAGLD